MAGEERLHGFRCVRSSRVGEGAVKPTQLRSATRNAPIARCVGWSPPKRSPYPHIRPQCVHTMLMPIPLTSPYGVASWGKRRFMIRCVAGGSTLMFRPVGRTRNGPVTTANIACALTRRFRRWCSGHRVQEMALPRTTIVGRGHTLRVGQQSTGNKRARCGDRERSFPRKPTRGKHPDTPAVPGVRSRPQPSSPDAAAGDRGAHCAESGGTRHVQRTKPSLATSARVQFSWFSAGLTPVTSAR